MKGGSLPPFSRRAIRENSRRGTATHSCGRRPPPATMRRMSELRMTIGDTCFRARLETTTAPQTVAAITAILPFSNKLIHVRWSGESCWVPLGDFRLGLEYENHTSYPAPGQILIYPGGISECEILVPYGSCAFASKVGMLAGNHFATILGDLDALAAIGRDTLWSGAKDIRIEMA